MRASDAAIITGGQLIGNPEAAITGGRADSRICRSGDLFVAVKGENADGNLYAEEALKNGASAALVCADSSAELVKSISCNESVFSGKALILVNDTLEALWTLAKHIRNSFKNLKVIGVTGSNGKTTTKEITASILRREMGREVFVSSGNYNSDIGLPLEILGLRPEHRAAVLEMGMNRKGEIALLNSIARPDIAVITNIGSAHVGMLGSRKMVAEEKKAILNGAGKDSAAVVGSDEPWAEFLLDSYPGKVFRFGSLEDAGWDNAESLGLDGWNIGINGRNVHFTLSGRHNLLNAMAAACAARALGASSESIAGGLADVKPVNGRLQILKGSVTVIRDCYNANPESLYAAFDFLNEADSDHRLVLVLGEMLELGSETEKSMINAGKKAAGLNPAGIFLLGKGTAPLLKSAKECGYKGFGEVFYNIEPLRDKLKAFLRDGDVVLLKGSRQSALERLDSVFKEAGAL